MPNKRKGKRIPGDIKAEVHDDNGMTFSTSRNISGGGIFISTPEPLKMGSEIELSLYLPGEDLVNIRGIVRWTNSEEAADQKCGMGIEFVNATKSDLNRIKTIIE